MIDLAAHLPELDGTLTVPGLAAPVTVQRDAQGVPHIRAATAPDAWFALGFVHAQDRLFQMDLTRRRAPGRAAEWLGAAAVEQDALSRRLGVEAACRRDYEAAAPETRAMLDGYAAGVNALIGSATPRPVEYALLDAAPERWEGWHCIAVMRRLGLLMGSVWFKLWRAAALPVVGAEQVRQAALRRRRRRCADHPARRRGEALGGDLGRARAGDRGAAGSGGAGRDGRRQQQLGGGAGAQRRPAGRCWRATRTGSSRSRHVRAAPPRLRRVRCHRPDGAGRAGLPALRP